MSAQDNFERILRSLHVVLARADLYPAEPTKVLVDRAQMLELLKTLGDCVYAAMEEYQVTQESRDRAERDFRKQGEQIVLDASHKAEDVYAASVMYTDEALNNIQDIMQQTNETIRQLFENMEVRMEAEQQNVRHNQLELRSQLQDLVDTEKYMKLIEDRNRQIRKEKKDQTSHMDRWEEKSLYANRQTEVRLNPEYFEMMGIPLDENGNIIEEDIPPYEDPAGGGYGMTDPSMGGGIEVMDLSIDDPSMQDIPMGAGYGGVPGPDPELQRRAAEAQVRVDLDSDYFKWKAQQQEETADNLETLEKTEEDKALQELSEGIHEIWEDLSE